MLLNCDNVIMPSAHATSPEGWLLRMGIPVPNMAENNKNIFVPNPNKREHLKNKQGATFKIDKKTSLNFRITRSYKRECMIMVPRYIFCLPLIIEANLCYVVIHILLSSLNPNFLLHNVHIPSHSIH